MSTILSDWLHLILRWFHLTAGIYWIGHSFYFMWLDRNLAPAKDQDENVTGELWMVHSGGYYQVLKRKITPGGLPETLHWFKWEAALTFLSGVSLLILIFYMTGGIYLLDSDVSSISNGAAIALCVGLLVVGWFVYDLLWNSSFASSNPNLVTAICLALLVGIIYGLTHVISGRAAYIHVGALFGTLMVGNVWIRIIPFQKMMINAAEANKEPDHSLGESAKHRSVHNNYMTFPLLFIMLSNHFPSTYGHEQNWLMLIGLILFGAGIRHVMNTSKRIFLLPAVVILAIMISMTLPKSDYSEPDPNGPGIEQPKPNGTTKPPKPLVTTSKGAEPKIKDDPKLAGSKFGRIAGIVSFKGTAPKPQVLPLPAGCLKHHKGQKPVQAKIKATNGRLQNVFVYIYRGIDKKRKFPLPEKPALLDQRGCVFVPHILGVRAGQKVDFLNSDSIFHNIKASTLKNSPFNDGVMAKKRLTKIFPRPETMIRVKCDVHPWMAAYIGVMSHPYYAVTDDKAEFNFTDLKPGRYTLKAWHESLGEKRIKVNVKAGKVSEIEFVFKN